MGRYSVLISPPGAPPDEPVGAHVVGGIRTKIWTGPPDYVIQQKDDPAINVYTSVYLMGYKAIETKSNVFKASVWLKFRWSVLKPSVEACHEAWAQKQLWYPSLYFANAKGSAAALPSFSCWASPDVKGVIVCCVDYDLVEEFLERFEVAQFPFDTQSLTCSFVFWDHAIQRLGPVGEMAWKSERPLRFVAEGLKLYNSAAAFPFTDCWNLQPPSLATDDADIWQELTDPDQSTYGQFPLLHVRARIARRYNLYVWSFALPVFFLVLVSLAPLLAQPDQLDFRINTFLSVLLTMVALKFVLSGLIPEVNYLTLLDKYLLIATVIPCITAICFSVSYLFYVRLNDQATAKKIDFAAGLGMGGFWLLGHVCLAVVLAAKAWWPKKSRQAIASAYAWQSQ